MGRTKPLHVTPSDRKALLAVLGRPSSPAGFAVRARIVLLSSDGVSGAEIARRLGVTNEHVCRVRKRFIEAGVEGLADRTRPGRRDHAVPREVVERVVQLALSPPPPGRTRWTRRLLAREVGLAGVTVSKILRDNELK